MDKEILTLVGLILSLFSLFWVITNVRIGEIIKRLERIEDYFFSFAFKKRRRRKNGS